MASTFSVQHSAHSVEFLDRDCGESSSEVWCDEGRRKKRSRFRGRNAVASTHVA